MKIKYRWFLINLIIFCLISCGGKQKPKNQTDKILSKDSKSPIELISGNYIINHESSIVFWEGGKLSGSTHDGDILLKSGDIIISESKNISGNFIVDMTTMNCLDIANENSKNRLLDHLKNDDFFDVENFQEASLSIDSSKSLDDNNFLFNGRLTIKGITNPVEMRGTIFNAESGYVADIKMNIDRSKYNIRYKSISFFDDLGDNYILDNIKLHAKITVKKLS
tara:strand:- start:639 stop:1307 length:669 start_codon:yes stop_codon:yes gene_type:complete